MWILEFIIIILFIFYAISYIRDDVEKKNRERLEAQLMAKEREKNNELLELTRQKQQASILENAERFKNTEFFQIIIKRLEQLIEEDILFQVKKGLSSICLGYMIIEQIKITYISSFSGLHEITFNSLGYNTLIKEEIEPVCVALESIQGYYRQSFSHNTVWLDDTYWQPIIDEMLAEHRANFKNIF